MWNKIYYYLIFKDLKKNKTTPNKIQKNILKYKVLYKFVHKWTKTVYIEIIFNEYEISNLNE